MSTAAPPAAIAVIAVLLQVPSHAQVVYKCVGPDGRITISNLACPPNTAVSRVDARPNTLDMSGLRREASRAEFERSSYPEFANTPAPTVAARSPSTRPASVCPTELEIRNMETTASSTTIGKKERDHLRAEVLRARSCSPDDTRYSKEAWDKIREANAMQNNIRSEDREMGRATAEAIHSSASPRAHAQIEYQRQADAQERQARRAQALADAKARASSEEESRSRRSAFANSRPKVLDRCEGNVCWSGSERFTRYEGGDRFRDSKNQRCTYQSLTKSVTCD